MKKYITLSTLFLLLFTNYTLNFIDNENKMFDEFQSDSESLVTGAIVADQKGIGINKWGMGRYMDVSGIFNHYPTEKNIDENWYKGYSLTEPSILLSNNVYTVEVAKIGNNIKFNNGALFNIDNVIYDEDKLIIKLSNDEPLNYEKYGSIDKISFFSKSMDMLESGKVFPYISNYGLQGWGFRFLAKMIAYQNVVEKFQIICSFLLSIVLLGIVVVIYKKYDILMSISFYITFLLSPWIINFARNLYWLEFTFFLPMLIGLFLSMNYQQKKYRILSYIFIFLSILFKSLCGYEYISSIMLGGIAFLITDFIIIFKEKEVLKARLLLMTIVIFGLFSLGGFICAISIHAYIRGDGNIFHGVESIFAQDMLRRLGGADLNEVAPVYWESLNASIWETLKLYFVFNTSIITGITGNFFVLLCLLSMVILVYNKLEKNLEDNKDFILYIVLFVTSISWFILAKAHSYIHLGMNYILWYFGYIQMCIYVICKEFFILVIDRINRRKII